MPLLELKPEQLLDKLRRLPPERLAEVADFVDFLQQREEKRLTKTAAKLSEQSFSNVWDNPQDAAYDEL